MRRLSFSLLLLLLVSVLAGCGQTQASEGGLEITKDGMITSVLVDSFEKDYYDLEELREMIQLEISQYNQEAGAQRITLESLEMKDGNCVATMIYQSAEDYASYNEVPFFAGTVKEALETGINLDVVLTEAGKDATIGREEVEKLEAYQMVVWYGDMPVVTPGKIRYYSEGLRILGSKKIAAEDVAGRRETEEGTSTEETPDMTDSAEEELAGPFYLLYK